MRRRAGEPRPLRIHQTLARQLGMAIVSGEYKPGDSFEGEIERSLSLGVSRTPYREAIRILVAKGLLESRPKVGTRVSPRSRWQMLDPDVLEWMFSSKPDEKFIRDLFQLRGLIEPPAAALAAMHRGYAHLELMRSGIARMKQHGLATADGQMADQMFHRAILSAADNEPLASLSSSVGAAIAWTTRYKQRFNVHRESLPEHIAVFEAIEAADAGKARAAMEALLELALADMSISFA